MALKWLLPALLFLYSVVWFGSCDAEDMEPGLFIFNELCAQKKDEGPCKAMKDRFYFDIDSGRCEHFDYGGCAGNENNFETMEACEETCVVSADKNPCHLEEAPGPCRGMVTRYFFDTESQECRHFFYGGCFGNANNFRTRAECVAKCKNPAKATKLPRVATANPTTKANSQPLKVTEAFVMKAPQVGDAPRHEPTAFSPPEVCLSRVDRGTCDGSEKRFAYSTRTKRCHMFRYSGCGGNKNNFSHRRQCMRMCTNTRSKSKNVGQRIRIKKKNINTIMFHSA